MGGQVEDMGEGSVAGEKGRELESCWVVSVRLKDTERGVRVGEDCPKMRLQRYTGNV